MTSCSPITYWAFAQATNNFYDSDPNCHVNIMPPFAERMRPSTHKSRHQTMITRAADLSTHAVLRQERTVTYDYPVTLSSIPVVISDEESNETPKFQANKLFSGIVLNAVFKSNLMIYAMFKSNHHLMCWKWYNLRFVELFTSLFFQQSLELDSRGYVYIPIKSRPLLNSNTTGVCDGGSEVETKDSGSLDGRAKADSPEKLELVESGSSKIRNEPHPWIRKLTFEPELEAIEEVTDEIERDEEMQYIRKSECEIEEDEEVEQEEEQEKEKEEVGEEEKEKGNTEEERDVGKSCDGMLEKARENNKDGASLCRPLFNVECVAQTQISATRVAESNVESLPQTTLNSAEELKTQLFSSRRRRPAPNWKDVLETSGSNMLLDQKSHNRVGRRFRKWWKRFISCGTATSAEFELSF